MNSLEIREKEAKLVEDINEIPLPLEIKRLMLFEIFEKVKSATEMEIRDLSNKNTAFGNSLENEQGGVANE